MYVRDPRVLVVLAPHELFPDPWITFRLPLNRYRAPRDRNPDVFVRMVRDRTHVVIEADERPGLAHHAPRPIAERSLDLLFPETRGFTGSAQRHEGPAMVRRVVGALLGAMTLPALRGRVGDEAFSRILRSWFEQQRGRAVTTPQFVALAEQVSGQDLTAFFDEWLSTPAEPASLG